MSRFQSARIVLVGLAGMVAMGANGATSADELPLFALSGDPPPGFGHLVEPQKSLVDVYFGGRFLISAFATYTPDSIAFEVPTDIVGALATLTDPEFVAGELGGELSTHGNRVCLGGRRPDCGELRPQVVGVIYDADRFRADLFVNPSYLETQLPARNRYLPDAQSRLTLLQNFSATIAGSDDADTAATLGSFTTVAMGESRFETIASYTENDRVTIDRMFFQRDYRGTEYVSGLFRTSGRALAFMGEHDLGGVRIANSLRTRADLAFARGSPIAVFLAAGSRVDLIKDGRLLSSSFYPAGNQVLDTSGLPDGSYDITIRIDDGGSQREEVRFFSKTVRIPPMDQPLSFLEMGRVLERTTTDLFPEDTDAWLARLGHSRRITESVGLDAGIAVTEDEQLFELGAFHLGQGPGGLGFYELQASTFVDAEADYGYSANGQLYLNRWFLGFDYRRIVKDSSPPGSTGDFTLVPEDVLQRSVTAQLPLFGGSLGFSARSNRRGGGEQTDSRNLTFTGLVMRGLRHNIRFTLDVSETEGDWIGLMGFSVNLRRGALTTDIAPRYRYNNIDDGSHGYQIDGYASWQQPDFYSGDLRLGFSGSSNADRNNANATIDYDHRIARSRLSVNRQSFDGVERTSWAGNVVTSVMTNGSQFTVGAQNAADAAILVTLEGDASGTDFDVLIDGQPRGYAPVGRTTPIHLASFRTYEVRIRPRDQNFVSFEDRSQVVTLYPGNVVNVKWEVADILVVFGRAIDPSGLPIVNARIEGVSGVAKTDDQGYFQVEAFKTSAPLRFVFATRNERCTVFASDYEQRKGVAFVDDLRCEMRPINAMPGSDGRDG